MKRFALSAGVSAAIFLAAAGAANAADSGIMATKAPPVAAPDTPTSCSSIWDFFATTCQLSYYGIRFYGTIDMGGSYETHGAPYNPNGFFDLTLIQKASSRALWLVQPDAMSQSNVGVQGKEQIAPGWYMVFDLEAGFNPYSLQLANGPATVTAAVGQPLNQQLSNGDSSRAGQFYNSLGFVGVSSPTYGTLTVFRQNSLLLDGILAYDPMGGSYAFSPIGFSGVAAGGGDTEDARYTTSVKYRVNIGQMRVGALWQFGGYGQGNGAQGAYQAQVGGDAANVGPGIFSFDVIGSYVQNGVSLATASPAALLNAQGQPIYPYGPQTLSAAISNNAAAMVLAKYTVGPLKLYGGFEFIQYNAPTGTPGPFTDLAGMAIPTASIATTTYAVTKGQEIVWTGAKYTVIKNLDLIGAYYHYTQNSFIAGASCNTSASSKCFGTLDAVSFAADWQFSAKADAYIGLMFSQVNGGLSNGYLYRNNVDPTAGLRFRF